ncbi:MAG TPA: phosphoribosyltransferase [bacterium]|nr:phosphoribosyltransferase [bacterium]
MRFQDRRDAGEQLARQLGTLGLGPATVLAIPRGGVIVADAIVRTFGWPLDVMLPRKLRAPRNPELAFGAVTEDGTIFLDARLARTLHVTDEYLREEIADQIAEITRRRLAYRGTRPEPDLRSRTAVLVDDGLATGATAIASVRMLRHRLAREVSVAIPVGPPEAVRRLEAEADRVICLVRPTEFTAVGEFYEDFRQTGDEEVVACLTQAWGRTEVS